MANLSSDDYALPVTIRMNRSRKPVDVRSIDEITPRFRPNCEPANGKIIRIPIKISIPYGSRRDSG